MNEVGAAIHIPPNATRVLKEWGCDLNNFQPTFCHHLTVNDQNGKLIFKAAVSRSFPHSPMKSCLKINRIRSNFKQSWVCRTNGFCHIELTYTTPYTYKRYKKSMERSQEST